MPGPAPLAIGFLMTRVEPGGTERQMIELVRRLDSTRWSVHVACFRTDGEWFGRVADVARSITVFGVRSFKSPDMVRQMWAFARWCRDRRLAVIHTTDLPANLFGLVPAGLAHVPVRIANRRELSHGRTAAALALQRVAYASAHKIVANSRAAADRLLAERVPAHRIRVVPNGLDGSQFGPALPRTRRRKVVVVANLRPEKAHEVLVNAVPDIVRVFPDASFEFVGDGAQRNPLIALARNRGVLERITFAGHCDDVPERLAAADIFVLPSRSEACSNAVLEAMAAGLPVVATAVGGIREVIDDGQTGLLVPPDDPRSLAAQICRLMTDAALADRLGHSARAHVRSCYSFDRMVAQFEQLYLSELARRGFLPAVSRPAAAPDGAPRLRPSEKVVS